MPIRLNSRDEPPAAVDQVRRPRVLSRADLPGDAAVAPPSECDCVQPEYVTFNGRRAEPLTGLRRAKIYHEALTRDRVLTFNPSQDAGVAVVDDDLFETWLTCAPEDLANLNPQMREAMLAGGLLEPVDVDVQQVPPPAVHEARPLTAWLHVTNACNLRCDYCYLDKTGEHMPPGVGFEAVDAVLRSAMAGGFDAVKLKFAGGEATLNADLVLALDRYARERAAALGLRYNASILSNGVFISDRLADACVERGIRLMISLDGLGAGHDRQRRYLSGKGSAQHVQRTIERLVSMGLRPFINITLSDRNASCLAQVVRFALERELMFNINFVRDNRCVDDFETLRLRDGKMIEALRAAFAEIEARMPRHSVLGLILDKANLNHPHAKACGAGDSYLVINQHGRIAKCHMEIEHTVTDIGATDPLAVVQADTSGVQNVRVTEKEGCRDCQWRHWCAGGCPKATYAASGRYDVRSPYCDIYRAVFPDLLRLEAKRLLRYAEPHP